MNLTKRNALIEEHMDLANSIGARMYLRYKLPKTVAREDLQQFAMIGLIRAADTYDPKKNDNFRAYASLKCRGAVIDGLRGTKEAFQRSKYRPTATVGLEDRVPISQLKPHVMPPEVRYMWREVIADVRSGHPSDAQIDGARVKLLADRVLNDKEKQILEMKFWDGMSFDAIADETGVSAGHCSAILKAAITRLKEHI